MVEVFKTNVKSADYANALVEIIQVHFPGCQANFDLHDCDNILRIQFANDSIKPRAIIQLLTEFGFTAEVLSDDIPISKRSNMHPFYRKPIAS